LLSGSKCNGNPEARIILSETAIYLAVSPKSNSAYAAINDALAFVKKPEIYQYRFI
jgi:replication-associated recombination protein RarA